MKEQEISLDLAQRLYEKKKTDRVAKSDWNIIFQADIVGQDMIVKIDTREELKASIVPNNSGLLSGILDGNHSSKVQNFNKRRTL